MKRILGYLMIGLAGIFVLAGCSDQSSTSTAPAATNAPPPSTNAPAK